MPTKPELLRSIRALAKEEGFSTSAKIRWNKGLLTRELNRLQKKKLSRAERAAVVSEVKSREALYLEHIGAKEDFFGRTLGIPDGTHYQYALARIGQDLNSRTEMMFKGLRSFTHMAQGAGELARLVRAYQAGDKLADGSEISLDDLLGLVEKLLTRIGTVGARFERYLCPDTHSLSAMERAVEEHKKAWEAMKKAEGSDEKR